MTISIIAAHDKNGVIGKDDKLPWHLPQDFKWFKENTKGRHVLMGRKTYESIGKALPGRPTIVISNNPDFNPPDAKVVNNISDGIKIAEVAGESELFILGGATIYEQTINICNKMYLTVIQGEFEGDTWFPHYNEANWIEKHFSFWKSDDKNSHSMTFKILERS